MAGLAKLVAVLFAQVCVATILAQGIGLGYLWTTGKLNPDKVLQMLAVVHDLAPAEGEADGGQAEDIRAREQPSYAQVEQARAVQSRFVELKLDHLENGLRQVRHLREQLTIDKERHRLIKTAFEQRLAALEDTATNDGFADNRLIWENIKPELAKQQILSMIDAGEMDHVVLILADMPIAKRAKIVSRFTGDAEVAVMDEILRMIRSGAPVRPLIEATRRQLQPDATRLASGQTAPQAGPE